MNFDCTHSSSAAERNYISQSSFSASISTLEKELGVNLLKRTNTGVEPTEFGLLVLEKAEAIFLAQEEILEATQNAKYIGTVSVNCIPGIYERVLPEMLLVLQKVRTGIQLSVTTAESREIARNISSGYSEFGIAIKVLDRASKEQQDITTISGAGCGENGCGF